MQEFKSMDYLEELVNSNGKKDTIDILEKISYLLQDNGHGDARDFLDCLIDIVDNDEL